MDFFLNEFDVVLSVERIANLHYFEFTPQYQTREDHHNFSELIYVDKGAISVEAENYSGELNAHNVWIEIGWNFSLEVSVIFVIALLYMSHHLLVSLVGKERSAVIAATLVAGIIYMTFEASLIVGALDYSLYFLISTFAGVALLDEKENELCQDSLS